MSERSSFWQRLFGRTGSSSLSPRQQKVSDYVLARMENEVPLRQVLTEDYVRRNCSRAEVERIVSTPEFIERSSGSKQSTSQKPVKRKFNFREFIFQKLFGKARGVGR
jgi:hypothetical protein